MNTAGDEYVLPRLRCHAESGEEQGAGEQRDAVAHDDVRDRLHERHRVRLRW